MPEQLPKDAESFSTGLEDDRPLRKAKLVAGALSVLVLIAMLVTTLFRAPNSVWTVLLAVVAAGLVVAMGTQALRHRGDRRRGTEA